MNELDYAAFPFERAARYWLIGFNTLEIANAVDHRPEAEIYNRLDGIKSAARKIRAANRSPPR